MQVAMEIPTQPEPTWGQPPASAAIADRTSDSSSSSSSKPGVGYRPPEGEWKDGLFACANQIAPSCAIATCLPCLGLALLAQRLGWSGDRRPCPCQRAFLPPDTPNSAQRHYQRTMLRFVSATIVVAFWLLAMLGDQFAGGSGNNNPQRGKLQWYDVLLIAAIVLFVLEFVMFLARLRARARARLRLPPFCGGASSDERRDPTTGRRIAFVGDACVSLVCPILVLAQLLRHLFDFRGRVDSRWPIRDVDAETLV